MLAFRHACLRPFPVLTGHVGRGGQVGAARCERDLPAQEPLDDLEREQEDVEGEAQGEAEEDLRAKANGRHQVADDLVDVGSLKGISIHTTS